MSWSFSAIGKPENVAKALDEQASKLAGQSRLEFVEALPALKTLLAQNFAAPGSGYQEPLIDFDASGSGAATGEKQLQRSCTVSIKPVYKTVV